MANIVDRLKSIATSAYNGAALRQQVTEQKAVVQALHDLAEEIGRGDITAVALTWHHGTNHIEGMIKHKDDGAHLFRMCLHENREEEEEADE